MTGWAIHLSTKRIEQPKINISKLAEATLPQARVRTSKWHKLAAPHSSSVTSVLLEALIVRTVKYSGAALHGLYCILSSSSVVLQYNAKKTRYDLAPHY